jgi:uncharacterized protein (TIGR03437 family)
MKYTIQAVLLLLPATTLVSPLPAQLIEQGAKLTASDASPGSYLGSSVAISADGNTFIVGGYTDNSNIGAAWAFTRSNGVWTQQGLKLVGASGVPPVYEGIRVGLSADGNTAIIGGDGDSNGVGAAWIFTRSGGKWSQQAKLVATDTVGSQPQQGFSVALSGDGNTAIVGGYPDNNFIGAAWVWTRSGTVWKEQAKLVSTDVGGQFSGQGSDVALSADGNTALVGAWFDNSNAGAAFVYTRNASGVWTQQGPKLVGSGAQGSAQQGWSVALSADGNTALVHGGADNNYTGAAWIWTRSNGVWTQQGNKLVGTGFAGQPQQLDQGAGGSLSADGNTAALGAVDDGSGTGAVWIFKRSSTGAWTQSGQKLVGSGPSGFALQGYSVALSADGSTLVEGGPADAGKTGAVWAFAPGPSLTITAVESASAYGGFSSVAPGSWVEIYGTNLAPSTRQWAGSDFTGNNAPTSLDGVQVHIGGQQAFVEYISSNPGQINVQLPSAIPTGGPLPLTVSNGSATSNAINVTVNAAEPGLLAPSVFQIGGKQYVVALLPDAATYILPAGAISGVASRPAKPNDTLTLYGVGFGPVTPAIPAGQIVTEQNQLTQPLQIMFGQTPAQVTYDGLAPGFVGLYQFDVVVPQVPDNLLTPLTFSLGGVPGSQTLYIAVQQGS